MKPGALPMLALVTSAAFALRDKYGCDYSCGSCLYGPDLIACICRIGFEPRGDTCRPIHGPERYETQPPCDPAKRNTSVRVLGAGSCKKEESEEEEERTKHVNMNYVVVTVEPGELCRLDGLDVVVVLRVVVEYPTDDPLAYKEPEVRMARSAAFALEPVTDGHPFAIEVTIDEVVVSSCHIIHAMAELEGKSVGALEVSLAETEEGPVYRLCWKLEVAASLKLDLFWTVASSMESYMEDIDQLFGRLINRSDLIIGQGACIELDSFPYTGAYVQASATFRADFFHRTTRFVGGVDANGSAPSSPPLELYVSCWRNCHSPVSLYESVFLRVIFHRGSHGDIAADDGRSIYLGQESKTDRFLSDNGLFFSHSDMERLSEDRFGLAPVDGVKHDVYVIRPSVFAAGSSRRLVSVNFNHAKIPKSVTYEFAYADLDYSEFECNVHPTSGVLMETEFQVLCVGFSRLLAVTYTFKLCDKRSRILKHGPEPWFYGLLWKAGYNSKDCIHVQVRDVFRIVYEVKLLLDVVPPKGPPWITMRWRLNHGEKISIDQNACKYVERYLEGPKNTPGFSHMRCFFLLRLMEATVYWLSLYENLVHTAQESFFRTEVQESLLVSMQFLLERDVPGLLAGHEAAYSPVSLLMLFQIYEDSMRLLYRRFKEEEYLDLTEATLGVVDWLVQADLSHHLRNEVLLIYKQVIDTTSQQPISKTGEAYKRILETMCRLILDIFLPQERFLFYYKQEIVELYKFHVPLRRSIVVSKNYTLENRTFTVSVGMSSNYIHQLPGRIFQLGILIDLDQDMRKGAGVVSPLIRILTHRDYATVEIAYPMKEILRQIRFNVTLPVSAAEPMWYGLSGLDTGDVIRVHMGLKVPAHLRRNSSGLLDVNFCEVYSPDWKDVNYTRDCDTVWKREFGPGDYDSLNASVFYKTKQSVGIMAFYRGDIEETLWFQFSYTKVMCVSKIGPTEEWDLTNCTEDHIGDDILTCHCQCAYSVGVTEHIMMEFIGKNIFSRNVEGFFDLILYYLNLLFERVRVTNSLWPLVMISTIWIVFSSLAVWARVKDRLMKTMSLPIDLADNPTTSRHIYLVIVKTGGRLGAGTTSRVYFNLTGTRGLSASHRLVCHKYQVLQRTHTNIFLMRTLASLGDLVAIKFWHKNMGASPAWFVSRVSIADLQSKRIYYFLCDSWVGSNAFNDVVIMKTFTVASKIMTYNLKYLITFNASRSFSDNHTLFSIFFCPITSRFTRFERVGVCLNLLSGYLMCNLFFISSSDRGDEVKQSVGRLLFSTDRIIAAFYCALIMFPVTTGIEGMFQCVVRKKRMIGIIMDWRRRFQIMADDVEKHTRLEKIVSAVRSSVKSLVALASNKSRSSREVPTAEKRNSNVSALTRELYARIEPYIEMAYRNARRGALGWEDRYNFRKDSWKAMFANDIKVQTTEHTLADYKSEKLENGFLPGIFSVMAWTVIISCVLFFSAGVVLGTSLYDDEELLLWSTACFMSFCIGMIIDDPFKIIIASLFYSLVVRKVKEHAFRNSEKYKYMCLKGLEYSHPGKDKETLTMMHICGDYKVPKKSLNMLLLEAALIKEESRRMVARLVFYITITVSCIALAMFTHDYSRNHFIRNCENLLFRRNSFRKIRLIEDFWNWVNTTFMDKFYTEGLDALGRSDYKLIDMEARLLRTGPCFRRNLGAMPVWAYYPSTMDGSSKGALCFGMTRASAIAIVNQAVETRFFSPDDYFVHLQLQTMDAIQGLVHIIEVKAFIMPGGGILIWGEVHALPLFTDETDYAWKLMANSAITATLAIFTIYTFRSLIYIGVADFFANFWNLIDLMISLLTVFYLPSIIFYGRDMKTFGKEFESGEATQTTDMIMSQTLMGFLSNTTVVLFVIKGLSYLRFSQTIASYYDYIWQCFPGSMLVLIMSLPFLLGLSTGLYTLFGQYILHLSTQEYCMTKFILHFVRVTKFGGLAGINKWAPFTYTIAVLAYIAVFRNLVVAIMFRKYRMYSPKQNFREQLYFRALIRYFVRFLHASGGIRKAFINWRENKRWKVIPIFSTSYDSISSGRDEASASKTKSALA